MRGVALLLLALTACVDSGAASQPSVTVVEQCSAESGFTARAAAAHASGVQGDIPGTPKELAAINACVKAKASMAPSMAGRRTVVETQGSSGTMTVETYTSGASAPKPAAPPARPVRQACRNTFTGGDGYACLPI
ncbi:hypothetical protein [Cypionkella psychrotolerans]|uniref:hypothetical protein n=1 Tax=Cypionkella psychrotolerans TaxID=1678131 RepID=UPI0006B65585|nr:hypothetical protein [Cypionkella psychrotolerans]